MNHEKTEQQVTSKIGTTTGHWFVRGLLGGVMLVAACNALSYFFRTPGIADLVGADVNVEEAVGFPFEIWRENKIYSGGMFVDYFNIGLNLLVGLMLGGFFGLVFVSLKKHFNRWVEDFENNEATYEPKKIQFSVKSLMIMTTLAGFLVAMMTHWHGTKEVLMGIYFFGPISLIGIAMLPKKIRWQHRVVILTITAAAMIGIALSTASSLGVPSDRVLLGIFVSWTPQSAFGAFLLTSVLVGKLFWLGRASIRRN